MLFWSIMASSTPNIEDGSDTNCKESCGLKYGISQNFHQNVIEQQKTKASKAHIQPQIFDDPNEQEKFKHMMHDVVLKTFNDEFGKKIFKKAFEGMESNYPEILHGSEEYMFYCPTSFILIQELRLMKRQLQTFWSKCRSP